MPRLQRMQAAKTHRSDKCSYERKRTDTPASEKRGEIISAGVNSEPGPGDPHGCLRRGAHRTLAHDDACLRRRDIQRRCGGIEWIITQLISLVSGGHGAALQAETSRTKGHDLMPAYTTRIVLIVVLESHTLPSLLGRKEIQLHAHRVKIRLSWDHLERCRIYSPWHGAAVDAQACAVHELGGLRAEDCFVFGGSRPPARYPVGSKLLKRGDLG